VRPTILDAPRVFRRVSVPFDAVASGPASG
jgi:hypothetical protein